MGDTFTVSPSNINISKSNTVTVTYKSASASNGTYTLKTQTGTHLISQVYSDNTTQTSTVISTKNLQWCAIDNSGLIYSNGGTSIYDKTCMIADTWNTIKYDYNLILADYQCAIMG